MATTDKSANPAWLTALLQSMYPGLETNLPDQVVPSHSMNYGPPPDQVRNPDPTANSPMPMGMRSNTPGYVGSANASQLNPPMPPSRPPVPMPPPRPSPAQAGGASSQSAQAPIPGAQTPLGPAPGTFQSQVPGMGKGALSSNPIYTVADWSHLFGGGGKQPTPIPAPSQINRAMPNSTAPPSQNTASNAPWGYGPYQQSMYGDGSPFGPFRPSSGVDPALYGR